MANDTRFGTLQKISASSEAGWKDEANDFTPWLAENLELLSEELGLALQFQEREHSVGRYSLDLLAEDSQGRTVVIENQFGQTNHDHLGKLLTYAAGTEAVIVIWIAESFTDEHMAVIEWLNDNTIEGTGFFAVVLELLKIGESRPAPHFRVAVKPNEWVKRTRPSRSEVIEWSWSAYGDLLGVSQERISIAQATVAALESGISERGLPWKLRFNKGYAVFQRPGGYNVLAVDVIWAKPLRLWLKLPATPEELKLENPYPQLADSLSSERESGCEWGWTIPSLEEVPDMGALLDLAERRNPEKGAQQI